LLCFVFRPVFVRVVLREISCNTYLSTQYWSLYCHRLYAPEFVTHRSFAPWLGLSYLLMPSVPTAAAAGHRGGRKGVPLLYCHLILPLLSYSPVSLHCWVGQSAMICCLSRPPALGEAPLARSLLDLLCAELGMAPSALCCI